MITVFGKLLHELEQHHSLILATIIQASGSAPRGTGAQMLVGIQGRICGTIGGGAVEYQAEQMALELLHKKESADHIFHLFQHPSEDIGMTCGGDVRVWLQYIDGSDSLWSDLAGCLLAQIQASDAGWFLQRLDGGNPALLSVDGTLLAGRITDFPGTVSSGPLLTDISFSMPLPRKERVVLFGGGHCAQALVPLLYTVGFQVIVFESRPDFSRKDLFPDAHTVLCGDYLRICDYLTLTPEDYVVVMTNGHIHDYEVQEQVLRLPLAYIGVIGSRKKTAAVNAKLRQAGISEKAIASVHTPIGTAIKAVTPAEIAVSIAGELIYERALRRERTGIVAHGCPMHE